MRQIGRNVPPGFLQRVPGWRLVFENLVITAREKFELSYLNIIEQNQRAVILLSSLQKKYHLE
jgi:hypothetical protein